MKLIIAGVEHPSGLYFGIGTAMQRIASGLGDRWHEVIYLKIDDLDQTTLKRFKIFYSKISKKTNYIWV